MHLALILSLALGAAGEGDFLLKVGDPAPPFSMRDLSRNTFTLGAHVGPGAKDPRKGVLIVFFATWCEPCKKEVPIIKKIHARWKKKGIEVIYVGLSQGAKELEPYAKQAKLPWPVIPDTFGLLSRRYGASQLPHALLVGPDGRIAFQHRGIAPDLQKIFEQALSAVTGEAVPAAGDEEASVTKPRFDRTLVLGRVPSSEAVASRWEPLGTFLSEAVQAQIDVQTAGSYGEFEKALREGRFDLANAGPLLCNQLKDTYEPLVRLERQGTPTYHGIIFAKRTSRMKAVADLKGKTLGLVSPRSTRGGLYPQKALLDAGLVPGVDVKVQWLENHTKVAEAVKGGAVDAGACYDDCRDDVYPNDRVKNLSTVVLGYTAGIPAELIVAKRSLPAADKTKLRKALLSLNADDGIMRQMSQGELPISAVAAANDADLAPVAEVLAFVESKSKAR